MDKSKEQFEEWAIKHKNHHNLPVFVFYKDHNGDYVDIEAKLTWQAWQASRAALVVHFPESKFASWVSDDIIFGYKAAVSVAKDLLDKAGIKWTE